MDNRPLNPGLMLERLEWPTQPVDVCLDTDTYIEIDDQFALVYALLSPERIKLEAVYAAPFHNTRSNGPKDGMEKGHDEPRLHGPGHFPGSQGLRKMKPIAGWGHA